MFGCQDSTPSPSQPAHRKVAKFQLPIQYADHLTLDQRLLWTLPGQHQNDL